MEAASLRSFLKLKQTVLSLVVWNLTSKQNCIGLLHCYSDTANVASINRPNSCARYSHGLQDLRKTCLLKKEITRIPPLQLFSFPPLTCVKQWFWVLVFVFLRGSFQCLLKSFHSSELSTTQSATRLKLQKILVGGQLLFPNWPVSEGGGGPAPTRD